MNSSLLRKTLVAGVGGAGLAIGFVGGYLVPRDPEVAKAAPLPSRDAQPIAPERTTSGSERTSSTRPLQPTAPASTPQDASARLLASLPAAGDARHFGRNERTQWVDDLPADDIPLFIEALCAANSGPSGIKFDDRWLIDQALHKWGNGNRQAVLAWVKGLPPGATKRFLFSRVLESVFLKADPQLAMRLAKDFKARDPDWDYDEIMDSLVKNSINKAWENPATNAKEMVELYSQLPRDLSTTGSAIKDYPENFDFRTFLDGLAELSANGKRPSRLPSDALAVWARADPQAATAWLMESTEQRQSQLPFYSWDDIAKAVASVHGSQGYYEWAAGVLGGASDKFLNQHFQNPPGSEVLGIVAAAQNPQTRDRLLTTAIRGADIESSIRYLGMLSTPDSRLKAITENRYTFQKANEKFHLDEALVRDLGLTREQVNEALKSEGGRPTIRRVGFGSGG